MSAPQYLSGEVGNVDATTVVVTFDQDVTIDIFVSVNPDNKENRVKGVRIYPEVQP